MLRDATYGAWVAFDLNLVAVLVLLALGIDLLLIGLFARGRKWHEYVSLFVAILVIELVVGFVMLQTVLEHPVVVIRDVFKIR